VSPLSGWVAAAQLCNEHLHSSRQVGVCLLVLPHSQLQLRQHQQGMRHVWVVAAQQLLAQAQALLGSLQRRSVGACIHKDGGLQQQQQEGIQGHSVSTSEQTRSCVHRAYIEKAPAYARTAG
jgi:hypothetical protein